MFCESMNVESFDEVGLEFPSAGVKRERSNDSVPTSPGSTNQSVSDTLSGSSSLNTSTKRIIRSVHFFFPDEVSDVREFEQLDHDDIVGCAEDMDDFRQQGAERMRDQLCGWFDMRSIAAMHEAQSLRVPLDIVLNKFIDEYGTLFGHNGTIFSETMPDVLFNYATNRYYVVDGKDDDSFSNDVFKCCEDDADDCSDFVVDAPEDDEPVCVTAAGSRLMEPCDMTEDDDIRNLLPSWASTSRGDDEEEEIVIDDDDHETGLAVFESAHRDDSDDCDGEEWATPINKASS